MKPIILLLIFLSGLFADTIKYKQDNKIWIKDNITFDKADDKYIYYITSNKSYNQIECNKVIEIVSVLGEKIDFNCIEENILNQSPPKQIKKITTTDILIASSLIIILVVAFINHSLNNISLTYTN